MLLVRGAADDLVDVFAVVQQLDRDAVVAKRAGDLLHPPHGHTVGVAGGDEQPLRVSTGGAPAAFALNQPAPEKDAPQHTVQRSLSGSEPRRYSTAQPGSQVA